MTREQQKRIKYLTRLYGEYKENDKGFFFIDTNCSTENIKCYKVLLKENNNMVSILVDGNGDIVHESSFGGLDGDSHYFLAKGLEAFQNY